MRVPWWIEWIWQETFTDGDHPTEFEWAVYFWVRLLALCLPTIAMLVCDAMMDRASSYWSQKFRNTRLQIDIWLTAFVVTGTLIILPTVAEIVVWTVFILSGCVVMHILVDLLSASILTAINHGLRQVRWPPLGPQIIFT